MDTLQLYKLSYWNGSILFSFKMSFPDLLLVAFKKKNFSKTVHLASSEFVMTNLLCLLPMHVRSPISHLDLKFFTGLGMKPPRASSVDANQNQKILLGDRVGLGLVDFLTNENSTPWVVEGCSWIWHEDFWSPVSQEQLPTALVHAGVVEQKDDNMSDGL